MQNKFLSKKENGQAAVEFALVLPLLLIIICGVLDFGWIFVNQYKVQDAAYQGARYASIKASELSSSELIQKTSDKACESLITGEENAIISVELDDNKVSVTVECPVRTLTFMASTLFGTYYNATATSISTY